MTNFERYNALHDEVMKRLEEGEITTEQAKSVIAMSFEKYCTETFEYEDDNELEIFEESARQKYVELLEKKRDKLQTLIKHATGEKRKELQNKLNDVNDQLYKYATGANKGGIKNTRNNTAYAKDKDGKLVKGSVVSFTYDPKRVVGFNPDDGYDGGDSRSFTLHSPSSAAENFAKDMGSKEPKNSELHDNITKNTEDSKKK